MTFIADGLLSELYVPGLELPHPYILRSLLFLGEAERVYMTWASCHKGASAFHLFIFLIPILDPAYVRVSAIF